MSSTGRKFLAGDLIWAKMKGFPPWPARVVEKDVANEIPVGRVPVMFYGTRETAFMKPSDLFGYMESRHQFEVPRKHKGFNEGVNEIRMAAGLDVDPLFSRRSHSPSPTATRSHRSSNNSKLFADVFLSGYDRKRNPSTSSFRLGGRSRTNSSASLMKSLAKKASRKRLDSGSSSGLLKVNAPDQRLVLDVFDTMNPLEGLEGGILDQEERMSRGSSRVFEEYMLNANRLRNKSGSEGKRSRLISGVSDVFDELFEHANTVFSAEALMMALDNLPPEGEDRPGTPEGAAPPLANTVKFCPSCGCECVPHANKYRCTSKFCLKWLPSDSQPSGSTAPPQPFNDRSDSPPPQPLPDRLSRPPFINVVTTAEADSTTEEDRRVLPRRAVGRPKQ